MRDQISRFKTVGDAVKFLMDNVKDGILTCADGTQYESVIFEPVWCGVILKGDPVDPLEDKAKD